MDSAVEVVEQLADRFEDYNEHRPHKGLNMTFTEALLGKGRTSGGLRSPLKTMTVRRGLRSQGLREKEVSILPLLVFHFSGRQRSARGEGMVEVDVPQRVCPLQ